MDSDRAADRGRVCGKRRQLHDRPVGGAAHLQRIRQRRHLAPSAEPAASAARPRVLRTVRRESRRAEPVRADRAHVPPLRRRRGADATGSLRRLQPGGCGGMGGAVRRRRRSVRQRAHRQAELFAGDHRDRRCVRAADGDRIPPASNEAVRRRSTCYASCVSALTQAAYAALAASGFSTMNSGSSYECSWRSRDSTSASRVAVVFMNT